MLLLENLRGVIIMKKPISILLTIFIVLSLSACNNKNTTSEFSDVKDDNSLSTTTNSQADETSNKISDTSVANEISESANTKSSTNKQTQSQATQSQATQSQTTQSQTTQSQTTQSQKSQPSTVQEKNAYQILIEALKKDGDVNGDCVSFTHTSDGYQYSVVYNSTKNYAYVSVLAVGSTPNDRNDDSYILIDLSGAGTFKYASYYGNTICYGEGLIDGSSYSDNSPLPMSTYQGNSSQRYWFTEEARLMANCALTFLSDFINQCIPEITIKDLGFKNF